MKNLVFAVVALVLSYGAIAGASGENCPVSANVRGHENIEWSRSYAYGLTDETRDLPRVLLIGDSICNGYQEGVRERLKGKAAPCNSAATACPAARPLRFMTFNIFGGGYGGFKAEERQDRAMTVVRRYAPDIVSWQEVNESWWNSPLFNGMDEYGVVRGDEVAALVHAGADLIRRSSSILNLSQRRSPQRNNHEAHENWMGTDPTECAFYRAFRDFNPLNDFGIE